MKKIKAKILIPALLILTALAIALSTITVTDIVRWKKNISLEERGIKLHLTYIAPGLEQEPFIINFSGNLRNISRGRVNVDAVNIYTVGSRDKVESPSIQSMSNFLDPHSKFKDAWFGVYIIFDDIHHRGRYFMLKDPNASPSDTGNINEESMILIPEMDQKIIVYSTHKNQQRYNRLIFDREFYFNPLEEWPQKVENVIDRRGKNWKKITGHFNTISALTDTSLTDMKIFSSIRAFIGLPDEDVYKLVDPWHKIIIKGSVLSRYFHCGEVKFWAVVYYNGSTFIMKDGTKVDTWENTDIKQEYQKMFEALKIECI